MESNSQLDASFLAEFQGMVLSKPQNAFQTQHTANLLAQRPLLKVATFRNDTTTYLRMAHTHPTKLFAACKYGQIARTPSLYGHTTSSYGHTTSSYGHNFLIWAHPDVAHASTQLLANSQPILPYEGPGTHGSQPTLPYEKASMKKPV